jgi:tetratricopeptide (TPR) repeat protein
MKARLRIILLLGTAMWAMTGSGLEPQEQVQFADGLYARGMWEVALKEYQTSLEQKADREGVEAVFYRMGECCRALGRMAEAEQHYERAYRGNSDSEYHFRAGLRRAELMEKAGRSGDQIALLETLLTQTPPPELGAACRYALGAALEKAGRQDEAVAAYQAVVSHYPGTPFLSYAALSLGSLARQKEGGLGRAEEFFRMAASNAVSPRLNAEAWFQLGDVYFRQKQYEKSARAYETLATLHPADERVPASRLPAAWAFYNAGLYAEAFNLCQEALVDPANPKQDEWLYLKANSERQLMRFNEASATYARLLETFPRAEWADSAAYERALTLYKMGKYQDALKQARALTLTPRIKKDVYWLLAESCAALKDDAGAVQYYRLLVEQFPASELAADALYRLAHLLENKGEVLQAAELYGQLAGSFPRHELAGQALFVAASCLGKAQKPEQALAQWARLIEQYPDSKFVEEAFYQKAMVEILLRRDARSLSTLRELMDRFPGSRFLADARFWSGVLLEESGKLEDAESEFRRTLQAGPTDDLRLRTQFRLALVLQRRGKLDEAAEFLQTLIASSLRDQFTPEILEWLTDYNLGRQDYAKAGASADLLKERASNDTWKQIGWCLKGKALMGLGEADTARQAFEQAVAVPLKSQAAAESLLRLGEISLAQGEASKGRAYFDRAATQATSDALLPIRARAYAGIARALKAEGNLAGAAKHFLSVAVLFEDPVLAPECLYEAAEAFRQNGQAEESAKVTRELQERYPDSPWAAKQAQAEPRAR